MKVNIKSWRAIVRWGRGTRDRGDKEVDVCGICREPYEVEGWCPMAMCEVPGDGCPLIRGECNHAFHMHCLLTWIETPASKYQCPVDRRTWVTVENKIPQG